MVIRYLKTSKIVSIHLCLGAIFTATMVHAKTAEERGLEIARDARKNNQGYVGEEAEVEMSLINAHGDIVKRKMTMKFLEQHDDGDRSLVGFLWPADVNGTKLLTWTHKTGSDDQWLYLPAIKRIKRISSQNKSGSFMGSEFAYEDLASQEVEKYRYKLLDEPKLDGRDTWRIERIPVDKTSGYARHVVWMDKQYFNPLKIEFYDRKNELLKIGVFKNYKQYGKYWRFETIEMSNVQTKKRSVLVWQKRKLNVSFPGEEFESTSLEG